MIVVFEIYEVIILNRESVIFIYIKEKFREVVDKIDNVLKVGMFCLDGF